MAAAKVGMQGSMNPSVRPVRDGIVSLISSSSLTP